jgi:hypothetical protein
MSIYDPDVKLLAAKSQLLMAAELDADDARWAQSPFNWIRSRPSRTKGKIGEKLVSEFLTEQGFYVTRSPDSEADRVVEGFRVEIKFSTEWQSGAFTFQQIRDQNYDILICLGLSPTDASMWAMSKLDIFNAKQLGATGLSNQHGGAAGTETMWLSFPATAPPAWLAGHGGKLRAGVTALAKLVGFSPP